MAKGKKSKGNNYTSKGERKNVARWIVKAKRKDYLENCQLARVSNQLTAFRQGKNVMLTIENPNKNETNKRFIRVRAQDAGWRR
jgi:hypothetical protein